MGSIDANRLGVVLAAAMAAWHVVWSLLVAVGQGQRVMDFVFKMHGLRSDVLVQPFDLGMAILLAVVAGFAAVAARQGRFALLAVAALAIVPLVARPLAPAEAGGWPVAIAYSLVLLATAIALITLEFVGLQGAARIGAALITILVILRMADADLSLLVKGVAFIVIGCGFLGFNALVSRRRTAAGETRA